MGCPLSLCWEQGRPWPVEALSHMMALLSATVLSINEREKQSKEEVLPSILTNQLGFFYRNQMVSIEESWTSCDPSPQTLFVVLELWPGQNHVPEPAVRVRAWCLLLPPHHASSLLSIASVPSMLMAMKDLGLSTSSLLKEISKNTNWRKPKHLKAECKEAIKCQATFSLLVD